jgi:uncharacterized protein (DUF2132 family)
MTNEQPANPLHGITLEHIVKSLAGHYGWSGLAAKIPVNCFRKEPSIKSSLKFLRRTPWAREKVESLYMLTFLQKSPWAGSRYDFKNEV